MREEEKKRTSKITKVQQFFRKRWVFPAIYLVSATGRVNSRSLVSSCIERCERPTI